MCVIGYAPAHVKIDDDTLEIMFYNNPDGAGIMWKPKDGSPIEIKKGFMTFDALLKAWHEIPVECEKAVHCRIATAGRISAQCCHPFPVRETTRSMKSRATNTDMAIMHNGIITLTDPPKGIKSPFSDTMMFAKEVLYPLKNALDNIYIQEMLENSINRSRLLIFRQHGETVMLGKWIKEGKAYFSNDTFMDTWYSYSSYTAPAKKNTVADVKKVASNSPVAKLAEATGMTLQTVDGVEVPLDYQGYGDDCCNPYSEYGFDEDGAYGYVREQIEAGQADDDALIAQAVEYLKKQEKEYEDSMMERAALAEEIAEELEA